MLILPACPYCVNRAIIILITETIQQRNNLWLCIANEVLAVKNNHVAPINYFDPVGGVLGVIHCKTQTKIVVIADKNNVHLWQICGTTATVIIVVIHSLLVISTQFFQIIFLCHANIV